MAKADKSMQGELALLNRLYDFLCDGNNARAMELDEDEAAFVKTLDLLSYKPIIYVANVQHRLRGKQEKTVGSRLLVVRIEGDCSGTQAFVQCVLVLEEHVELCLCLLVATYSGLFFYFLYAVFDGFEVLYL